MIKRKHYALDQCGLYCVTSPEMLAERLSTVARPVTVADLENFANGTSHYSIRDEETNGKTRRIEEPKPRLQAIHGRVHTLMSRVELPGYVHSVKKGRSYISNAQEHVGRGELVKLDVESFYRSARRGAVAAFFQNEMRCSGDVAALLAKILTIDGHLPTGSRSSPIISYFAYRGMFDEMAAYADRHGLTFTLYVDDMSLSGSGANSGTINAVRRIVSRHGLRSHKIKQFGAKRRKVVTGCIVTTEGLRLPNRRHLRIKDGYTALHAASTRDEKLDVLRVLTSQVHEAAQIEPRHKPSAVQLDRLRRDLMKAV